MDSGQQLGDERNHPAHTLTGIARETITAKNHGRLRCTSSSSSCISRGSDAICLSTSFRSSSAPAKRDASKLRGMPRKSAGLEPPWKAPVSEYQYHEFLAVHRPLDAGQLGELASESHVAAIRVGFSKVAQAACIG